MSLLFIVSTKLALIALLIIPVSGIIIFGISHSIRRRSARSQAQLAGMTSMIAETIGSMRIVKALETKGFEIKDKIHIAKDYLLPEIYELFNYTKDDIIFTDQVLTEIISKYTAGEEGVRNLKRCMETIISMINIYNLTKDNEKEDIIDMKIKNFKLPLTLTSEHITSLLKIDNTGKAPEHLYI